MALLTYITSSSKKEAEAIAAALIEQKLAACVNIFPQTRAVYLWNGQTHNAEEVVLLAKTTEKKFDLLQKKVRELHSYETPCIIAAPIVQGSPDFLAWIEKTLED